jgi:hypothetical protein
MSYPFISFFWRFEKCISNFLQTYGEWKHPEWDIAFSNVPLLLENTQWLDELTSALRATSAVGGHPWRGGHSVES